MIDHPKCATCIHYVPHDKIDEWDTPPNFGRCKLITMTSRMWEFADNEEIVKALKHEYANYLAGVMDGSNYRAEFYPAPEFYCPMHSDLMTTSKGEHAP